MKCDGETVAVSTRMEVSNYTSSKRTQGSLAIFFDGRNLPKGKDYTLTVARASVASESGEANSYGLFNTQERGRLFVRPGDPIYEGQIVGECSRNEDIVVNVCKRKHVTNMRASGSDEALRLTPPVDLSLEQCMEFIRDDELVEVTPKNIRMRKRLLTKDQRIKEFNRKQSQTTE